MTEGEHMYNRIYPGGDTIRVPPDYGGSAIKPEKELPNCPPPPPPPCPEPEKCVPPPPPCEKSGGYLGNLLSKISADDLIIYGVIIYMTLQEKDNDLLLLLLLIVVLM